MSEYIEREKAIEAFALCDPHCPFRRHFPYCVCCDIAMEYRRCKSEEQEEEGDYNFCPNCGADMREES